MTKMEEKQSEIGDEMLRLYGIAK